MESFTGERCASEMQKYSFAFPSPALPTEGGRESEIGGKHSRLCAGSVFRPAGKTSCRVGMSQFTARIFERRIQTITISFCRLGKSFTCAGLAQARQVNATVPHILKSFL